MRYVYIVIACGLTWFALDAISERSHNWGYVAGLEEGFLHGRMLGQSELGIDLIGACQDGPDHSNCNVTYEFSDDGYTIAVNGKKFICRKGEGMIDC